MRVVTRTFALQTQGRSDIVDITDNVLRELREAAVTDGTATLFVSGSTAGITAIEVEPGLLRDFQAAWERIVPRSLHYQHNVADDNGHSHVRASMLGPSLVVPIVGGRLILGTWQRIILMDFDTRPRQRQVAVQAMGQ